MVLHIEEDYKTAVEIWRPFAEQGDADAQSNLGAMYCNGARCHLETIAKQRSGFASRLNKETRRPEQPRVHVPKGVRCRSRLSRSGDVVSACR